jgi:pimeloyl-ACP methyl ester carboxylesterase
VVLVHGALGDYRQWLPVSAYLAADFHAVAISRRHHWPDAIVSRDVVYSYESHRDDLLAVLRTFPGPVHVVGHSYGAGLALLAAIAQPERIATLTLVEPALGSVVAPSTPGYAAEVSTREAVFAAVHASVAAGADERAAEIFIDWVQGESGGFGRLGEAARQVLLDNAATIGPTLSVAPPRVTREQLTAIRAPTCVVTGERTRPWYRLIADAVAAAIPDARQAVVPACAHMTIVERPLASATPIRDFLAAPRSGARS